VSKIQKPKLGVKNPRGSDIEWSNPYGDQATHFDGCIESPNADNSSYNRKNARTTYNARPIICVSFAKEGKTQVGWDVTIR
jgi:hypothetical protein